MGNQGASYSSPGLGRFVCAGNPKIELMGEKKLWGKVPFSQPTLISLSGEEDIWLKSLTGMWTSPGIHPPHVLSEELGG